MSSPDVSICELVRSASSIEQLPSELENRESRGTKSPVGVRPPVYSGLFDVAVLAIPEICVPSEQYSESLGVAITVWLAPFPGLPTAEIRSCICAEDHRLVVSVF